MIVKNKMPKFSAFLTLSLSFHFLLFFSLKFFFVQEARYSSASKPVFLEVEFLSSFDPHLSQKNVKILKSHAPNLPVETKNSLNTVKLQPKEKKGLGAKEDLEIKGPPSGAANTSENLAGGGRADALSLYLEEVRKKIDFHKVYPKASQLLKEEGLVKIQIRLSKQGEIKSMELIAPSPYERLNKAALLALNRAAPFAPSPQGIAEDPLIIEVPIRFVVN